LSISEIRGFLNKVLPDYMIPSFFVQLEKIPLTPNGKVDRNALPKPDRNLQIGGEYVSPQSDTEKELVHIWQEILSIEQTHDMKISVNDSFFDLGGHSLKATALMSSIHQKFNVEIPLKEIFNHPTIKDLAEYIDSSDTSLYEEIKQVREREYYPVSSAQKRVYVLSMLEGGEMTYNMPGAVLIEGNIDKHMLENAFSTIIQRHEVLRTSFQTIDGEPVQKIQKYTDFQIDVTELQVNEMETEQEAIHRFIQMSIKPFNLQQAPLLRIKLLKIEPKRYVLFFDMHHIISDGITLEILLNEFTSLYNGENLSELRIQYKDFTEWQSELFKTTKLKKQEEYWLNKFAGEIPVLNIPTDFSRPPSQSFEGDSLSFSIDKEQADRLKKLATDKGTTMYMVLLSAYNILLSKYTGQEDIIVGSPIAGRQHEDLKRMMGMFVNTLAMRNYPEGHKTYERFLEEVKDNALSAYENQDYPFEELVEQLKITRDLSRNPLFDTMFVLQNMDMKQMELNGLKILPYQLENKTAKFDITFNVAETKGRIDCVLEYCTKLFEKGTIERFFKHYQSILKIIVDQPSIQLSDIEILSPREKQQLLVDFNNTEAEYPKDKTIHELFEEQAERTPQGIAVVYEDEQLTYQELNERANQLARVLRNKGVKRDSIIGIMADRSLEMVIGMMGILKAGGAYL
ncbi:condensation domain-containing protein, partial [Bacillus subtilis]